MREDPSRDMRPEYRSRRGAPPPEGPLGQLLRQRPERDPAPFIIGGTVAFVALVIALVFVFSSVLDDDGGEMDISGLPAGVDAKFVDVPALPAGLRAVSKLLEFEVDQDVAISIDLPLQSAITDSTGLGFYTFLGTRWERIADVELRNGGTRGAAEFSPVPANLAVLRVVETIYEVSGSLPSGGSLHSEARLDVVSPRDYLPLADGSLQGASTPVQTGSDVLLIPTIVGSGEAASAIVDAVLADESLQASHIQAIATLAREGGFDGIDLEYSAVDPSLSQEFTGFITELRDVLRSDGIRLSLTLPPPTGDPQAYEWRLLGEAVDTIRVLPISDPLDYWLQMPAALSQIVDDVAPTKVMLVVSPHSVERVGSAVQPIGYRQAMTLATEILVREPTDPEQIKPGVAVELVAQNLLQGEGVSTPVWSDEAAIVTVAFGGERGSTIYFENLFSVGFKLEMVQAYGLGGAVVSDASAQSDVANIWPAMNALVDTAAVTLLRPNGDALLPRWQASDGGSLDPDAGATAVWIAPSEEGAYAIALIVSDGESQFGQETTVEVRPGPSPVTTATPTSSPSLTFTPTATPALSPSPGELPTPTSTPTTVTPPPLATATPAPVGSPTPAPVGSPTPAPSLTPTPDQTPPGQVTGLAALPGGASGKITLVWTPLLEEDLERYNIWRSITSGGPYDFVASVPDGFTVFTDTDLESGTTYYYLVTAADTSGNDGPPSDEAFSEPTP